MATLRSYGSEDEKGRWKLDESDSPRSRREDLREIKALLHRLGDQLGYRVQGDSPIEWFWEKSRKIYSFHVIASSLMGELLLNKPANTARQIITLPGGRSELVLTKIERDPRLQQSFDEGWHFLKFRHVRRLAENQSLTRESFDELLGIDPLTIDQPQAPLL